MEKHFFLLNNQSTYGCKYQKIVRKLTKEKPKTDLMGILSIVGLLSYVNPLFLVQWR